jgi:hypothetical protein
VAILYRLYMPPERVLPADATCARTRVECIAERGGDASVTGRVHLMRERSMEAGEARAAEGCRPVNDHRHIPQHPLPHCLNNHTPMFVFMSNAREAVFRPYF